MSNTVFIIGLVSIVVAAIFVLFVFWLLFRKSFLFTIISAFVCPLDVCALAGFVVGAKGLIHLTWAVAVAWFAIFFAVLYLRKALIQPVVQIQKATELLQQGDMNVSIDAKYLKGSNEVSIAVQMLDKLIHSLKRLVSFANEIGKGNLSSEYIAAGKNDQIAAAMMNMRDNLKAAEDEKQKRREEDSRRNWVTDGIAKFAEILRTNNENLSELSQVVISNLVKYIEANQGGIFILNDDDHDHPYLEMTACYAYDRKKFTEKRIEIGEGLVGTCYLEGESIYMTELPKDYVHITSGLGDDTPRTLLITPLKLNDEIYGIIELAAFKKFDHFVMEFVEKVAESIASSIGSVKTHMRTSKLLEMSKMQAEEMTNQEEELRQNMEEMQATQEESIRREKELSSALEQMKLLQDSNAVNVRNMDNLYTSLADSFNLCEFSPEGIVTDTNELTVQSMHTTKEETIGSPLSNFIPETEKIMSHMKEGKKYDIVASIELEGRTLTIKNLFVPFMDAAGNLERFVLFFYQMAG